MTVATDLAGAGHDVTLYLVQNAVLPARNGAREVGLLLRGNAVCYAVGGQDAAGLRFGTRAVKVAPDLFRDIAAVLENVPVNVVAEDATERGIPEGGLMRGVERVARERLGQLFNDYDRIIHW